MKVFRYLSIAALAVIGISCAKEPVFEPEVADPDLIPLNISGSIDQVPTRATAQGFVDGDAVGLYAVNYLENNTIAGTLGAEGNQADNVKYVFDEANYKWVPVKSVYYKDINTHVDLYLYYPYEGSIQDVNAVNFEVKKDQSTAATSTELSGYEASDWMWGKAEDVTPSQSSVPISLKHKLSAIKVTLNEGTGWDTDEFASVSKGVIVTNTTRKATLNYATGDVAAIGEPQLDGIVMCPQSDGTFRAVVIPQTVDAGTSLFSITVNGVSYSFTQNNPVTYQQGKMLNASININKKTPTGDFELELAESQIVPWTEDLYAHGGEARQYFVVDLDTPGTLCDVIAAAGKNPDKIRNLKVTGQVNGADFYYMRDYMPNLEAVNMKETTIVAGQQWTPGMNYYNDNDDNQLPPNAFRGKSRLYTFIFPESVTVIGHDAFRSAGLAGNLVLPNSVKQIDYYAFIDCNLLTSFSLPDGLISIGYSAFGGDYHITGNLNLPHSLTSIGDGAFANCTGLTGPIVFPDGLEVLGWGAFRNCSGFTGNITIPDKITKLSGEIFINCSGLGGQLDLNNVTDLSNAENTFSGCRFNGELFIPEGVVELADGVFLGNCFTSAVLPSTLRKIGRASFGGCSALMQINIPEIVQICDYGLSGCSSLLEIELPASLIAIGEYAFSGCYGLSKIVCKATEEPSVYAGAFDGVAKDNFAVEVPEASIVRYQSAPGWSDFKRITAHYDFNLSRRQMRTLNAATTRTYILRAPADFSWSIQDCPEWVSVVPASGTGKTIVAISVSEMPRTNDTFEVNEGSFLEPSYVNYKGRLGQVIFKLDDNDYSFTFNIEQYDSDYQDGDVHSLFTATHGPGIDIVFTGEGYDARDIAKGTFISHAEAGYEHFFDVEPYKTYKDYFNVYAVTAMSNESGMGTVNTIIDNKFGSTFTQNRLLLQSQDAVFNWAKRANSSMDLAKSLVILLQNVSLYEGITYMYSDGSALACCPVSTQAYPYDFRGIIQHEAGGHGFGKLGDEYIYHNAFIQNCICWCCEHPQGDDDMTTSYGVFKSLGWYKNLSMSSDITYVPWAHLIFDSRYSNYVDLYEGGYMHSRGVYRSEATSCMNNNIPHYSAISRQAIVERIKYCAGETFSLEEFYANDSNEFGTRSSGWSAQDYTFGVDPHLNHATGHGPILVGEHPNVK